MSELTKRTIIENTIALAETKLVRRITVNEIVTRCGITRNTFYYYFHDVYDVLDSVINDQVAAFNERAAQDGDWDTAIFDCIAFVVSYKKVWLNLYKSFPSELFRSTFLARIQGVIRMYIETESKRTAKSEACRRRR